MPMHVVVISYYYPPNPAVGGLRAQKVARALAGAGHTVTVIAADCAEFRERGLPAEPGIEVVPVTPLPGPRDWYAALKRRIGSRGAAPRGATGTAAPAPTPYQPPTHVPLWKRFIHSLTWLPDAQQGFIRPAVREARRRIAAGATMVYTTAPPFSALLAGLLLKRATGVRWVAEFRDPWTDNPWKPWHVRTRLSDRIERWLEEQCLRHADLLVAVSDGIADLVRRRVGPERAARVLTARNGIERLEARDGHRRLTGPAPRRIVHMGTFYHGRNPEPFLRALARVRERHRFGPEALQVLFVGQSKFFRGRAVADMIRAAEVEDLVVLRDWVPHAEAMALVRDSDLLLLLAQDQPLQVPNKLYEYLGAGCPILAYVDAGGESERLLQEVGGHWPVTPHDPAADERCLEWMVAGGAQEPGTPDQGALMALTTERQMAALLAAVEGIR